MEQYQRSSGRIAPAQDEGRAVARGEDEPVGRDRPLVQHALVERRDRCLTCR